ncbi:MAG: N-methyl-L-tryptophan oxidase [Candidatus Sericytochromatia bacterium]
MIWDVAVIGLGAMGSAISYYLAQQGARVLGLDRFAPPHNFGSSHGQTRVIREAYFEHPAYVPLLQKSYTNWERLEAESGQSLLLQTGGLMLGKPDSSLIQGSRDSAERHGIAHEILSQSEIMARYPAFSLPEDCVGLKEQRAGLLYPEKCIASYLDLARRAGAEIVTGQPLLNWQREGSGYLLQTPESELRCEKLVIASGAWTGSLLRELALPLQVTRQVLFWFATPDLESTHTSNPFSIGQFPIFLLEYGPEEFLYGFPDQGEGFKIAQHLPGRPQDPDQLSQSVEPSEIAAMTEFLKRFFPRCSSQLRQTAVCMYTNTPDGHFLIDSHPEHDSLWLVSPCSGHGFKFASALGEVLAEAVLADRRSPELDFFSLARLLT